MTLQKKSHSLALKMRQKILFFPQRTIINWKHSTSVINAWFYIWISNVRLTMCELIKKLLIIFAYSMRDSFMPFPCLQFVVFTWFTWQIFIIYNFVLWFAKGCTYGGCIQIHLQIRTESNCQEFNKQFNWLLKTHQRRFFLLCRCTFTKTVKNVHSKFCLSRC